MRTFRCTARAAMRSLLLLAATVVPGAAWADPFTYLVGGDGAACDFSTIQAAIDAAATHAGPDVIHVATNASYTAQALRIGAQDLSIIGGFATCASATPTPAAVTLISGAGGAADSVLAITGAGNRGLANLRISDGDDTDNSVGGGIDFAGQGMLVLSNVIVSNNKAGYGGGINFNGSGGDASLVFDSNVVVQNNIAANSGGGVRVEGSARLYMLGAQSTITGNEARGTASGSGYGGGVQVVPPAGAEIGSPGFGNLGAVAFNLAKYGAGIAVSARDDGDDNGYALLYTTDPLRPARIQGNIASVAGGGVYLSVNMDLTVHEFTRLCAYEFRIDHNQAPDGAAIYLDSDSSLGNAFGADAFLNVANNRTAQCGVASVPPRSDARNCAPGTICNRMDGNVVRQANGQPGNGAIVSMREHASVIGDRLALVGNTGTDLIHGLSAEFQVSDCLFADNTLAGQVAATDGRGEMANCTVAGNTIGLSTVLSLTATVRILDSIIWQPGKVSLAPGHGALDGGFILTNDPDSLPLPITVALDPRFIDPAHGDYHLRAASPAIDVAVPDGNSFDLDFLPYALDLPNTNAFGPRDLGAYERQSLDPLVLNGNFDTSLSQWNEVMAGVSAFDANENNVNSPNAASSGAMSFNWINGDVVLTRVTSRAQCMHLPVASIYRLNGSARTTGGNMFSGQTALLHWELRRDGSETCSAGPADQSGDLPLASGTAWHRAAAPAFIEVSPGQWTSNSSITISTVMVSTGITVPAGLHGWFDGIELTLDTDRIFANGFQ